MNDLQLLQGRLEVIPEEDDLNTSRTDTQKWQEAITQQDSVQVKI